MELRITRNASVLERIHFCLYEIGLSEPPTIILELTTIGMRTTANRTRAIHFSPFTTAYEPASPLVKSTATRFHSLSLTSTLLFSFLLLVTVPLLGLDTQNSVS